MAAKEEEYRWIFAFLTRHHYLLGFLYARWMCWKQYPLLVSFLYFSFVFCDISVLRCYAIHEWIFPELCPSPLSHPFLVPTTPVAYWWCGLVQDRWPQPHEGEGRAAAASTTQVATVLWSWAVWAITVSLVVLLVVIHSGDVLAPWTPLVTPLLSLLQLGRLLSKEGIFPWEKVSNSMSLGLTMLAQLLKQSVYTNVCLCCMELHGVLPDFSMGKVCA